MADVLAIVGPTASGKTGLAVAVALAVGGEIIGTDSMQAYRGMDIGTATPAQAELRGVPHHMLDCWEPSREVSVAEFQARARACIADVLARGRVPIVTGGSGLYVSAVLDDLRFPGTDPAVRARLEEEAERLGAAAMHARLALVDPLAAAAILPGNSRRVVRALEVNEITGANFAATLPEPASVYDCIRVGLDIDRGLLDMRIAARVDEMIARGFLGEVERLVAAEALGRTAGAALGYPQMSAVVSGEATLAEARQGTIDATRKFARRQQRWFRRDARIAWVAYDAPDAVDFAIRGLHGTLT